MYSGVSMQPDNRTVVDSDNKPTAGSTKRPKRILRKLGHFLRKFWYVVVVVLAAVITVVVLQVVQANRDSSWQKASEHFSRAEYSEAKEIIEDFPVPADAERQRVYAQTMLATGTLDKALNGYNALYKNTEDVAAKLIIGNIYNQQKKYDEAITIYREVISANPSNVQAYVNLATVYRLQNKNAEAAKVAAEAVKNNPQSVTLLELQVSMLMDDKNSPEYIQAVKTLREVNPNDPLLQAIDQ